MEAILLRTTPLSQRAEPSPLWFGTFPKRLTGRGTTRISRLGCGQRKRGCASRVPPSPGATARRTRGMLVVRATPPFLPLVRHGGGHGWKPGWKPGQHPFAPLAGRSLSPQGSLAGRPPDVQSRSRWMSVAACSFVTYLWLCAVERRLLPVGANPAQQLSLRLVAARADHGGNDMV